MKLLFLSSILVNLVSVFGWSIPSRISEKGWTACTSRRELLKTTPLVVGTITAIVSSSFPTKAQAASVPTAEELEKLRLGHARLRYLLDNWDDVTKVCGATVMSDTERRQVVRTEGGGGTDSCTKNPLRVQEFIGYKSINDPLYRADKLMVRASPLVNPDQYEDYLDAVEQFRERADNTAVLAYTSSWGEANPNGSKETIDEYLDQTKYQAVESEKVLRSILEYLNLKPLPPLPGKL